MGFIFYMSSNNGQISHNESTKVVNIIEDTKSRLQAEFGNKTNKNSNSNTQTEDGNKATTEKIKSDKNTTNVQNEKINVLDHIVRKNAHGFLYMVLAILVSNALFYYNKKGKDAIIYIVFISLFYAVTDEFHQSFVPGRTSLVSDVLVDFAGALIGLLVFYFVYYKIIRRQANK
jgi:VanZ family protein